MKCCICKKEILTYGNNPWPLCNRADFKSVCCSECNNTYVLPARVLGLRNLTEEQIDKFIKTMNKGDK